MGNEKLVVRASLAKIGKGLLGGFQVTYRCPRCQQELTTKNDAIAKGDSCPNCNASFVFDDEIRKAYSAALTEKQAREATNERIREAKQIERARRAAEKARLAAEAEEREALAREQYRAQAAEQDRVALRMHEQSQRTHARNVSDAVGCVSAMLAVGGIGTVFLLVGAFAFFSSANSLNDNASKGVPLLIAAGSTVASLAVLWVLSRFLGAIHAVLVMILDRLSSSSDRN